LRGQFRAIYMPGKENKPLVSIIIPCFNHGAYIKDAVASALMAASVAGVDFEIIVVDDGSTDPNTLAELKRLNSKQNTNVLSQANRGGAGARNSGLADVVGEFFVPLDADDLIAPAFLKRTLEALRAHPECAYAYTDYVIFGAEALTRRLPPYNYYRLLWDNQQTVTALIRTAAARVVGGYNESLRNGFEDWEFWIKMGEAGHHGWHVPEPLFKYRKHARSSLKEMRSNRLELIRRIRALHPEIYMDQIGLEATRRRWRRGVPPGFRWFMGAKHWLMASLGGRLTDAIRRWGRRVVH